MAIVIGGITITAKQLGARMNKVLFGCIGFIAAVAVAPATAADMRVRAPVYKAAQPVTGQKLDRLLYRRQRGFRLVAPKLD